MDIQLSTKEIYLNIKSNPNNIWVDLGEIATNKHLVATTINNQVDERFIDKTQILSKNELVKKYPNVSINENVINYALLRKHFQADLLKIA